MAVATCTQSREHSYEKCLQSLELLHDKEQARQLRVRIILLEDDKQELRGQLSQNEDHIDSMESWGETLQLQLTSLKRELEEKRQELRLRTKDITRLKVGFRNARACMI